MSHHFPTKKERFMASLCHLSPLIPLVIILLFISRGISITWMGILFFARFALPMLCWKIGKQNPWIVHHAKSALNFQITQTFILLSPRIIVWALIAAHPAFVLIRFFFFSLEIVLLVTHVILAVKAAMIAQKNMEKKGQLIYPKTYPLTIPFFRAPNRSRQLIELPEENPQPITMNKNRSNDANQGEAFIRAIPISLGIWFIGFIVSWSVGMGMAGPEIYDYEYDPHGAWRHANDGTGIIATTISHLFFWIGLVFNNKYLTHTNIFVALAISLPYLCLFYCSWWFVIFLIFFPNG
jgi:uncharacterized Tic20 family protein